MRHVWLFGLALLGCSSDALPPADVVFLTGHEEDVWTASPPPTRVQVELVLTDGRVDLGQAQVPVTKLTIATPPIDTGRIGSFEATGYDASGSVVVRGATVPFLLYGIEGISVPIFVARTGGWSRPPSALEHPHHHALAEVAVHEYVLIVGGDAVADSNPAVPDVYDFATWSTSRNQLPLQRTPKSMAIVRGALLAIDDLDATWISLVGDETVAAKMAEGLTFGEIAGGETVALPDGTRYVVGGTRMAGDPTAKVLRIDDSGNFRTLTLAVPRLGAAAAVVGGKLVVAGGSASGPGAEVMSDGQTSFAPIDIPAEPTTGLGLGELNATTAVLAGGKDPVTGMATAVRTFNPTCTGGCVLADLGVAVPMVLQRTKLFSLATGKVLVVGETEDEENHTFMIDTSSAAPTIAEHPLRERRKGATPVLLPNSQVALLGGEDPLSGAPILDFEAFFP